ncbi:hypothetical protein LPY97_23135 [Nocardia huaxiensis]|nr:hypothetical protein [Nocardia huaxiensis]UFS93692.1 hypothetical protein LPY97_23135 [Nocardia huaxiensis]
MCRHLAYLGPPTSVGDLLTRGPHSLLTQSWAPREMRGGGTINADGFGVAWWLPVPSAPEDHGAGVIWHGGAPQDPVDAQRDGASAPARGSAATQETAESARPTAPGLRVSRYRNAAPIWTDPAVEEVLPQLRSSAVLAAIRSATVGMPVERAACAPFTHGRWAFSHNGAIPDWRRALTAIAARCGSPSLLEAESLTDSAALWVILRGLLEGTASPDGERVTAASHVDETENSGAASAAGASASATGEDGPIRSEAHTGSFGTAASYGSAVSVTVTSGSPPEVRSWSWGHSDSDVPQAREHASNTSARGRGLAPDVALRWVVSAVLAESPRARLNLLLGDGETVWATTWHHSLSILVTDEFAVVASEPYDDDPRWEAIGDRMLVEVRPGWKSVRSLDIETGRATS